MKALILSILSIFSIGINRIDVHQPRTRYRIVYDRASTISQSFTSNKNNLNIVSICIRNTVRVLEPMQFNLYEATTSSEPVRTLVFSSGNIDNQDCTRFQFDPIRDSEDKQYIASIERTDTKKHKTSPIYIEAYNDDDYKYGTAFKDGIPTDKDLHFKTFYRQTLGDAIQEAIKNFTTRFFIKDKIFALFYIALILITTLKLYKIHKSTNKSKRK